MSSPSSSIEKRIDPCSLSNLSDVITTHLHLSLKADFNNKKLSGYVEHKMKFIKEKPKNIIFDSRDLSIHKIIISCNNNSIDLLFNNDKKLSGDLGIPLIINLDNAYSNNIISGSINECFNIKIYYNTNPESIGIQWLDKSQTDGKEFSYVFTQFQAIHARTAVPCQDSPSNKITYSSDFTVPKPLKVLMSAIKDDKQTKNDDDNYSTFVFNQNVPIPTYLLAFVIGDLKSASIGPRSSIWTEPNTLDKAAFEFDNTEIYIKKLEEYLTKYEWGIYDILCLPGSFPYGGMENPCLTFVTPTLLASDKSLTSVVCHEIAHSWTGNLVTNATWEHFWLNEGFTVFTERKIYGKLYGKAARHFYYILGNKSLNNAIQLFGKDHPFTALVPTLENIDPDEAFSSIPYEKGSQFLFYLESLVGEDKFDVFFRQWIINNKFKSVTTQMFQDYFKIEFGNDIYNKIDWNSWLYNPGYPPIDIISTLDDSHAIEARNLASIWIKADKENNNYPSSDSCFIKLAPNQRVYFLDQILIQNKEGVSKNTLEQLNNLYNLNSVNNSEIRMSWLSLCLTSKDHSCFSSVISFITTQGRMKFVRPLYRLLAKCDKEGYELANSTFKENKSFYHNIAVRMIEQDLSQIEKP